MGSDVIGFPCPPCMEIDERTFAEIMASMNQMYYQEEEDNGRSRAN
jgi:hypothetical protein